MAYGEDLNEVNSSTENFTVDEWEEKYEILFEKYKKIKMENKGLKKKNNECIHDTTISDQLETYKKLLEEERKEKESVMVSLDEMKLRVQKLSDENKLVLEESNALKYENSHLKSNFESSQKNLIEIQNKLKSFIKGKHALDNLAQLTSNKNKKGLGFKGQSSKNSK